MLASLRHRARKFPAKDIATKAKISNGYVCDLINGDKSNPSLAVYQKLDRVITKMEEKHKRDAERKAAREAKKFSSENADEIQSQSRDKTEDAVAGHKA